MVSPSRSARRRLRAARALAPVTPRSAARTMITGMPLSMQVSSIPSNLSVTLPVGSTRSNSSSPRLRGIPAEQARRCPASVDARVAVFDRATLRAHLRHGQGVGIHHVDAHRRDIGPSAPGRFDGHGPTAASMLPQFGCRASACRPTTAGIDSPRPRRHVSNGRSRHLAGERMRAAMRRSGASPETPWRPAALDRADHGAWQALGGERTGLWTCRTHHRAGMAASITCPLCRRGLGSQRRAHLVYVEAEFAGGETRAYPRLLSLRVSGTRPAPRCSARGTTQTPVVIGNHEIAGMDPRARA